VRAWRSDIDALPIEEAVDVPWRSENPGVMHACGHDLHLTVGLGAAELLAGMRAQLEGTLVFLFQPAEEGTPPGEEGGATLVLAEGALDDPRPEAIFGLHVMPTLKAGTVGWRSGGLMASSDHLTIRVEGRATHGSAPHDGVDAIWVASQVVTALQGIAAREVDSRRPVVVSIGTFRAGSRFNIVAASAELTGTVRTLDEASHDHAEAAIRRIVDGVCSAHRATCTVGYERSNPVLVNDADLTARSVAALSTVLGEDAVLPTEPIMAAEDVAGLAREVPGFYFHLGVGNAEKGWTSYVHTATFQPDEAAIRTGVEAAAALLLGAVK
jgi:amidohydrolase